MEAIVINKENLGKCEVSLSTPRTAEDSEGNKFTYYWAKLGSYLCCTGSKFTALLNVKADATDAERDAALKKVIVEHQGEFVIAQAEDEDGPIFINDEPDRPLLKIQAKAHSVTLDW